MHPARFSPRASGNGPPIHRATDDKEKCCLESRSWLNLGHPDDGACTFSTILLFLLLALPREFDGTTPFLSLSRSLRVYLSCAYSNLSFSPSYPSLFLSLCLSPQPLSAYVPSRPSIASFSLPAPFFSPPDTIQGSSSGGRPDANRRKKERIAVP